MSQKQGKKPIRCSLALSTLSLVVAATALWAIEPGRSTGGPFEVVATDSRGSEDDSAGGLFRVSRLDLPRGSGALIFADDFETGDASRWSTTQPSGLPPGAVTFFWATTCPDGWSELAEGRGRTVVGQGSGGSGIPVVGSELGDLEELIHGHFTSISGSTSSEGSHLHDWSILDSLKRWRTRDNANGFVTMISWSNGIDNSGSGVYPFSSPLISIHYTSRLGSHAHSVDVSEVNNPSAGSLPYVQMLLCRKD